MQTQRIGNIIIASSLEVLSRGSEHKARGTAYTAVTRAQSREAGEHVAPGILYHLAGFVPEAEREGQGQVASTTEALRDLFHYDI